MDFIYFLSLPPKLHGEAPGHRPGMAAADDLPEAPRRPGGRADGGGHGHPPEHVLRRHRRVPGPPGPPGPGATVKVMVGHVPKMVERVRHFRCEDCFGTIHTQDRTWRCRCTEGKR